MSGHDTEERALARYIDSFTATLLASRYSEAVIRQKCAMVARFVLWLGKHDKRPEALRVLDEATVRAFLAHLIRTGFQIDNFRCTLLAFLEHLRRAGVTVRPKPAPEVADSVQVLLRRYEAYLRDERGLTAETADNYLRFVHPLLRIAPAVATRTLRPSMSVTSSS